MLGRGFQINVCFKTGMLGRDFQILIEGVFHSSSQLMWDLTIRPPLKPRVLAGTHSFLQSM